MKLKGMTTAAATSGAQPEKAKELEEAKKHGAGVAERDGVQPTATWLQVHMQFMFLSLFFFSLAIRLSAHPSPASLSAVGRSPFAAGKLLELTMFHPMVFLLVRGID